jgi:PPOX class probable F420-dependent enzyme
VAEVAGRAPVAGGVRCAGMDRVTALDFLARHHRGVLATTRSDGNVQMSPVVAGIDDEGLLVVSSRETAFKVKNLRTLPYATYCGFPDDFFGEWVQVEGPVEIVSLPDALEPLVEYYRRISGEHPDWEAYRAAMVEEKRVLIRLQIERAGPTRQG